MQTFTSSQKGNCYDKTYPLSWLKKTKHKEKLSSFPACRLPIPGKHAALSPQRQISCVWMWSRESRTHSAYANRFTDNQLRRKLFKQKGATKDRPVVLLHSGSETRRNFRLQCIGLDYKLDYVLTEWCHEWEWHRDEYILTVVIVFIQHKK